MRIPAQILSGLAGLLLATGSGTSALARPHHPAVSANLSASPTTIVSGQSTALTWTSSNAASCTGQNFWTGGLTSGTTTVDPMQATTYSISCTGVSGGSVTASAAVQVGGATFTDTFSSYPENTCMSDGTAFGAWTATYAGYGCIENIAQSTVNPPTWLSEAPKQSTTPSQTHAALTLGPRFTTPFTYNLRLNTVKQLRTGSPPNPWEVGWALWNYTDDTHFYYITLKPNGWELGKEDPAYPGAQRFLATGGSPTFPVGANYDISITQDGNNTMTVSVNGKTLVTFTDTQTPYTYGYIGLYTEDAKVNFTNVSVALTASPTQ